LTSGTGATDRGVPRIVVSALRGGSGKTLLSIGVIAALRRRGKTVAPFKKGPDYIDAGWLSLAADRPCYNLDTFLIASDAICRSFFTHAARGDMAVIEGNRGLYDGIDDEGTTSTAELAKLLNAPVVLCIDCTKSTRTMAAVVDGCRRFDPEVRLEGVILNRVAGARHQKILTDTIQRHCGVPVLGAVPKLRSQNFPERHMGLVPTPEHAWAADSINAAANVAETHVDLDALSRIAHDVPPDAPRCDRRLEESDAPHIQAPSGNPPKIGIIRDSAFQFYYPENIGALTAAGAEVVFLSPLAHDRLPDLDALYIGGGFPETHAGELARNEAFRRDLKAAVEDGLPIYAECGGLMYLGEALVLDGTRYPMAGVLPVVFGFSRKPQGHGYTVVRVDGANPYFEPGTRLRGHEFHYSKVLEWEGGEKDLAFFMERGAGLVGGRDGAVYKNVLATYTHIHALGAVEWGAAMCRNARAFRMKKKTS
jgi:cobyrinic acid a,c-diamide synthase